MPNSFPHLLGGFIGETHGEDLVRRNALVNQVADSVSDDACFSTSGTCQNQERTIDVFDGLSLFGV